MTRYLLALPLTLLGATMPSPSSAQQTSPARPTIQVISSTGLKAVFDELIPAFEKASGYTVVVRYGPSTLLKQQIEQGAVFDLTVLTPALLDDLAKQGKVVAGSKRTIARAGMAIAIRKGGAQVRHRYHRRAHAHAARGQIAGVREGRRRGPVLHPASGTAEDCRQADIEDGIHDHGRAGRPGGGERRGRVGHPADERDSPRAGIELLGPFPGRSRITR
jgi:hypothetical protein